MKQKKGLFVLGSKWANTSRKWKIAAQYSQAQWQSTGRESCAQQQLPQWLQSESLQSIHPSIHEPSIHPSMRKYLHPSDIFCYSMLQPYAAHLMKQSHSLHIRCLCRSAIRPRSFLLLLDSLAHVPTNNPPGIFLFVLNLQVGAEQSELMIWFNCRSSFSPADNDDDDAAVAATQSFKSSSRWVLSTAVVSLAITALQLQTRTGWVLGEWVLTTLMF